MDAGLQAIPMAFASNGNCTYDVTLTLCEVTDWFTVSSYTDDSVTDPALRYTPSV